MTLLRIQLIFYLINRVANNVGGSSNMNLFLKKVFKRNKTVKLEFCQNNLDRFLDEESFPLFKAFFNEKNVSMKEYKCLSECELCKKKLYAKANGEVISADHSRELLTKLKLLIRKE